MPIHPGARDAQETAAAGAAARPLSAPGTGAGAALRAAVAGLVATGAALGAGELAAGLSLGLASPVVAVSEVVVDVVPGPVERWAIATFGAADKAVLVTGTVLLAVAIGAAIGLLARRRIGLAAAAIGAFGVLGALAALRGSVGGALATLPSLVAGAVGAAILLPLVRRVGGPVGRGGGPPTGADTPPLMRAGAGDRRAFLRLSGVVTAGAAVMAAGGRTLSGRLSADSARAEVRLPAAEPAPALPGGVDLGVDGVAPFTTPTADFYRVDTALVVPQVRPQDWRLEVGGMVARPLSLTYDELLARPLVEADITLTCVSNTVGGGLVGNARWQGVRLRDLLEEAGVDAGADQVVGRSVDGYTGGFPVAAAFDRETLVAVGMNGEPLPVERGFPARLVTPGLYGYVSATKWLRVIELTRFDTFEQYWVPRGWDEQAPIKTMARIDVPRSLAEVAAGPVDIAGVAWAQTRGIAAVEVRIDDGPWTEAALGAVPGDDTWRQWHLRWDAEPGSHRVTVRATDGTGAVQTEERADPFPNGASGWQTLLLTVTAPSA